MRTKKFNFAVLRSAFGDYWVGKIKQKPDKKSIFSTFDEATNRVLDLTDSILNQDDLEMVEEDEVEELSQKMEKWII